MITLAEAIFSAWFGGVLLTVTGSYVTIWLIDIGLCLFASAASGCIGRKRSRESIPANR